MANSGEWESKYDKAVSSLVRETLTISEGFFLESSQRAALRRLLRKSIYGIMDGLKEIIIEIKASQEKNPEFDFKERGYLNVRLLSYNTKSNSNEPLFNQNIKFFIQ